MDAYELLLNYQIKPSVQRLAIMKYLIKHCNHPTAEEIYTALYPQIPTLSKTTVYNTLKLFSDQRAVRVVSIDEKNTRFELSTDQHAHFMCRVCGKIVDFPTQPMETDVTFLKRNGHQLVETHYYYKGVCEQCKDK